MIFFREIKNKFNKINSKLIIWSLFFFFLWCVNHQVYDSKLVNPFTITFEQCSTNTFQVTGSCSLEICYLYFYRNGTVGWIPQSVEIYGSFSTPAVFFFNSTTVPEGEWYGINKCQNFPGAPPPSSALRLQIIPGWFLYLILGILATSIFLSY